MLTFGEDTLVSALVIGEKLVLMAEMRGVSSVFINSKRLAYSDKQHYLEPL